MDCLQYSITGGICGSATTQRLFSNQPLFSRVFEILHFLKLLSLFQLGLLTRNLVLAYRENGKIRLVLADSFNWLIRIAEQTAQIVYVVSLSTRAHVKHHDDGGRDYKFYRVLWSTAR